MNKLLLGAFLASIFLSLTACSEENPEQGTNPPAEQPGDSTDPGDSGDDPLPEYPAPDRSTIAAFPGAEGAGKLTTGGAGGTVYTVTSLKDDGSEGTLRWAIEKSGKRTIVFAVGGTISLTKQLQIKNDDITIAGQTAPQPGICLKDYTLRVNANNVIIRFIRSRMGDECKTEDDAMNGYQSSYPGKKNIIIDHCSMSWSTDECASFYGNTDFTMQWCIISESLTNSIHTKQQHGYGGIWGGSPATFHHNLLAHHSNRTPRLCGSRYSNRADMEQVDLCNNVIYNWGNGAAYNMGGESSGHSNTVIENNYFIKGPAYTWVNTSYPIETTDKSMFDDETKYHYNGISSDNKNYLVDTYQQVNPTKPFIGGNGDGDFDTYCVGNYYDNDKDGTLNGFEITQGNWQTYCSATPVFLSKPDSQHSEISIKTSATEAYHWIVKNVGPVLPNRDLVDKFMIDELTSLGTKGTIFRNQNIETQYPLAKTWQNINVGTARKDTDGDGIPDDFEDKWGLNKNNAGDAVRIAENGYTMIENYALSLEFPDEYEKAWNEAYGE